MNIARILILATLLPACYSPPHHVVGVWDRIFSNGVPIPPGTLDRLTIILEGDAIKERDGRIERGSWSGGDLDQYTFTFPNDVTSWSALKRDCPDAPAPPACLVLHNETATDWYRGNLALLNY